MLVQVLSGFQSLQATAGRLPNASFHFFSNSYSLSFIHSSMALQPFVGPWPLLQFRILFFFFCTVGRILWTTDQPVTRPLPTHRTTQTQNKRAHRHIPWMGFEQTIPGFERAKTVHASDCAAILIGKPITLHTVFTTSLINYKWFNRERLCWWLCWRRRCSKWRKRRTKKEKYVKEEENKTNYINLCGLHTYIKQNTLQKRNSSSDFRCGRFMDRNVFGSSLVVNSIKPDSSTSYFTQLLQWLILYGGLGRSWREAIVVYCRLLAELGNLA
jgi:hypothetical protein